LGRTGLAVPNVPQTMSYIPDHTPTTCSRFEPPKLPFPHPGRAEPSGRGHRLVRHFLITPPSGSCPNSRRASCGHFHVERGQPVLPDPTSDPRWRCGISSGLGTYHPGQALYELQHRHGFEVIRRRWMGHEAFLDTPLHAPSLRLPPWDSSVSRRAARMGTHSPTPVSKSFAFLRNPVLTRSNTITLSMSHARTGAL
jgi:hypothetical protein